ncbi:MAG: NTP transferase domain-containing protein [Candidatus Hydrothermarchaeales archaeon]
MLRIKAVILAAGRGERFEDDHPKPLAKLFGKPLIDYTLDILSREGIADITVVYNDKKVKDHVIGRVNPIFNPLVEREEGYSLLLGAKATGGSPFLLLMADHFIDCRILEKLLDSPPYTTTLCIDRDLVGKDIKEATKVFVEGSIIQQIGKEIEDYNALDTGVFMCTDEVLDAAKEFDGRFTVSDVMNKLSRRRRLSACDVTGLFWRDIDTKNELQRTEEGIINTLVKPTDGFVSRYINRKVSIPLSRMLAKTPLTPDQMSFFSFFLGIFSAMLFALGYAFYAGILAQISSITDGSDGEIARMKNMESKFGAYLDSLLDRYADVAIVLGMIAMTPEKLWHIGGLALLGTYSISYSASRIKGLTGRDFTEGVAGFMTRDLRLFIIMLGGILNQIFLTLLVLAILTNFVVASRIISAKSMMKRGATQTI